MMWYHQYSLNTTFHAFRFNMIDEFKCSCTEVHFLLTFCIVGNIATNLHKLETGVFTLSTSFPNTFEYQ